MVSITINPANPRGLFAWQVSAHNSAIENPKDTEIGIVKMIVGWANYAALYRVRYDQTIGDDGYAADYWQDIGKALRKLLCMDHGTRLDSGTLDSFLLGAAREHGCNLED